MARGTPRSAEPPTLDFLVIGAQKAGTTSLCSQLSQHPAIYLPPIKENTFFSNDEFYNIGSHYLSHFYRTSGSRDILGGADVHLLYFSARVAPRIHAHNKNIRLIALLRNPIDRAYSSFWFARRLGTERASTFEEALALEEARSSGTFQEQCDLTYLRHGHYANQLKPFFDRFGDQIRILFFEDIQRSPRDLISDLIEWLGVDASFQMPPAAIRNPAGVARLQFLNRLLHVDTPWRRRLRTVTSPSFRALVRHTFITPLLELNTRRSPYPPMNPATRRHLRDYYRSHNIQLRALLCRDLPDWA